jgi:hypothetical protein
MQVSACNWVENGGSWVPGRCRCAGGVACRSLMHICICTDPLPLHSRHPHAPLCSTSLTPCHTCRGVACWTFHPRIHYHPTRRGR